MPASSVQRRKQGSLFPSELGFSMNVDWHQEATLGPQSLLKTLAACQRSSNFATQRKPCWQLVRSQGVTWRPGGNNIFQNAQANRPMMGDWKDCRYALSCPRPWSSHPSLRRAEPHSATFMAELGTLPFVLFYLVCYSQAQASFYLLPCFEFISSRKINVNVFWNWMHLLSSLIELCIHKYVV